MNFRIDPEFRAYLPPQRPEEHERLRKKIVEEGVLRGSIIVGVLEGERYLIDGHNTHDICVEEEIDLPAAKEIVFASRAEVFAWMRDNQLSRRNLTDEQRAYYIGHEYLSNKTSAGIPTAGKSEAPKSERQVATETANKHDVSPSTVRADAEFAQAVDAIAERDGPEAKEAILSGESGQSKKEVIEAAKSFVMCRRCSTIGRPSCPECRKKEIDGLKPQQQPAQTPQPASRAPAPKPDVLRDDAGRVVPNALVPIFEARAAFRHAKKLCENAGAAVKRLEETDAYRMVDAVLAKNPDNDRFVYSTYFRSAASYFGNTTPAQVCPACKGKIGQCDRCDGKGFLTIDELEDANG